VCIGFEDRFLCLAFAQLTFRECLRDIETCLNAVGNRLCHADFRRDVTRSTSADANWARDWRIFADFALVVIRRGRELYADDPLALDRTVFTLDTKTIDLFLSLFLSKRFRKRKGAVKLHTLIDLRGDFPRFINISPGKLHDMDVLDPLPIEAGAFYVMGRGAIDFKRLDRFETANAFFVTGTKSSKRPACAAT
jgi:hypothetical protein